MKIAVYAIAKNEERFVERWARCSVEADYRVVTDTGSSDRTVEMLRSCGVHVHQAQVTPWRFDVARNLSLEQVPHDADVCISLDLDEVLMPGWRQAIERAWKPDTTMLRYPAVQKWFNDDGITPQDMIYGFKVHSRRGYFWQYAVHEVLRPKGKHLETRTDELKIHQFADHKKDRGFYRDLLIQGVTEIPSDSRCSQLLGAFLYDQGQYAEALAELTRYLRLPDAKDPSEKAFVMRVAAWSKKQLNHSRDEIIDLLFRSALESPRERECWGNLANELAEVGNWPNCFSAAVNAIRASDPFFSYKIEAPMWMGTPERLYRLSGKQLGIPGSRLESMLSDLVRRCPSKFQVGAES